MVVKWIKYFSWMLHDSTHNSQLGSDKFHSHSSSSLTAQIIEWKLQWIYLLLARSMVQGVKSSLRSLTFFLHWLLMSSCVSDLPSKVVNLLTLLRFLLFPISLIISWVDLQSAQGEFIIKTISEIISLSRLKFMTSLYLSIYPSRILCVLL